MLNETQQKTLGAKIKADIAQLGEDIAGLEKMTQPISPDNAIGRLSRMDAINTRSANQTALHAARIRLAKLQRVLPCIGDEEFGECDECLAEIPFARLMLVPESEYCVSCAEKLPPT